MGKYEYDESKDQALSIMDSLVGHYQGKVDDEYIFKMKDKKIVSFTYRPYGIFIIKVKTDKGEKTVEFGYGSSGRDRIDGGIAIITDIGRFRPQALKLNDETKRRKVSSFRSLSIRQLWEIAEMALDEYRELLKEMYS